MIYHSLCKICLSHRAEFYCDKYSIDVIKCLGCGLIYVDKIKAEEDIKKHYSEDYFKPYLKDSGVHLKKRFKKRIKEIKKIKFPGNLFDVGAGAGFFLKLAADEGYKTYGVELSRWAAKYAKDNFDLDIFPGKLNDAGFSPGAFDVVTLWHVLEHVVDPKDFLSQVSSLLKSGGLLAVEVPNIGSIAAKLSGINWELMAPDEHFFYFNQFTLEKLLTDSGFKIIKKQSYFWTTPAMLVANMKKPSGSYGKVIVNILIGLASMFSFLRFKVLPGFIKGDVITFYALKVR